MTVNQGLRPVTIIADHAGDDCSDFTIDFGDASSLWLTVGKISLHIRLSDEGEVSVDAYPYGNEAESPAIDSLYAYTKQPDEVDQLLTPKS